MDKDTILTKAIETGKEKGYVDIVKIANDIGISVFAQPMPDTFNAQISYDKNSDKYKLLVNANHSIGRQRFSIAHELGHYVLHNAELLSLGKLNRDGDSIMEEQADTFAAEVLMPKELITDFFEKENNSNDVIDKNFIQKVADTFRVSKVVAIIRLRDLGFYVPFLSLS